MFQNRPLGTSDDTARLLFSRYGDGAVEMAEARCRQLAVAGSSKELASWKQVLASVRGLASIETRDQLVSEIQSIREAMAIRPARLQIPMHTVFDGPAIGAAIAEAIRTPDAILGFILFVTACLVLTGRFLVLREHAS